MWRTIKKMVRGETEGNSISNKIDFEVLGIVGGILANKFNTYYIKSIKEIIDTIDWNNRKEKKYNIVYRAVGKDYIENFEKIDEIKLEQIISNLPNKKGISVDININILKNNIQIIKDQLTHIINKSMAKSIYPQNWKTAAIITIPKLRNPKKTSDYRPINILPIYEKILEMIVKEQLGKFIEKYNLLSSQQAGYRKNYSCEAVLQYVIND